MERRMSLLPSPPGEFFLSAVLGDDIAGGARPIDWALHSAKGEHHCLARWRTLRDIGPRDTWLSLLTDRSNKMFRDGGVMTPDEVHQHLARMVSSTGYRHQFTLYLLANTILYDMHLVSLFVAAPVKVVDIRASDFRMHDRHLARFADAVPGSAAGVRAAARQYGVPALVFACGGDIQCYQVGADLSVSGGSTDGLEYRLLLRGATMQLSEALDIIRECQASGQGLPRVPSDTRLAPITNSLVSIAQWVSDAINEWRSAVMAMGLVQAEANVQDGTIDEANSTMTVCVTGVHGKLIVDLMQDGHSNIIEPAEGWTPPAVNLVFHEDLIQQGLASLLTEIKVDRYRERFEDLQDETESLLKDRMICSALCHHDILGSKQLLLMFLRKFSTVVSKQYEDAERERTERAGAGEAEARAT